VSLGPHTAVAAILLRARALGLLAVPAIPALGELGAIVIAAALGGAGLRPIMTATATALGLGLVLTPVSPAVTTPLGQRRRRDGKCGSTGCKHPNAHGKSPFNEEKPSRQALVPLFIGTTGWLGGVLDPVVPDALHGKHHQERRE
jgi:hypothetical protein